MKFRPLSPVVIGVLSISVVAAAQTQTPERSRTQGLKETEQFVKAGGDMSAEVTDAKMQVQKTLDSYNALVTQPSKNMKGDYKKLLKAMDSMNSKVDEARAKIDSMEKMGDTYFSGRADTIANIQDASLQKQAKDRLSASQKEFGAVLQSLRDGGKALEPFKKQLADQITYLGSDLTPSAMTSLKPQAQKLNTQGSDVLATVDHAIERANSYFQGLRSSES
jgi:hypothetical protein